VRIVWAVSDTTMFHVYYHCSTYEWDQRLPEFETILTTFELMQPEEMEHEAARSAAALAAFSAAKAAGDSEEAAMAAGQAAYEAAVLGDAEAGDAVSGGGAAPAAPDAGPIDMAAAIDQVPGSETAQMKEPGTVKHDSEKGKDLEKIGRGASQGAAIGGVAGIAASPTPRGFGVGGLAGIAAGSMIGLLARGSDVRFESGTVVDVVLNHAIALDQRKLMRRAAMPAYYPQPLMVPMQQPQQ
jgi:hypothetical protein